MLQYVCSGIMLIYHSFFIISREKIKNNIMKGFISKSILLTIILFCLTAMGTNRNKAQKEYYLFAYFSNNTTEGQQVCYAVSENGYDFVPLNGGRPIISADSISVSGGVRDPHLYRGEDGWIYMVLTDMDMAKGKWSNRGIVMMKSQNLIDWTHACVHFPTRYEGEIFADVNAVWAPQTIYDPGADKFMIYFSLHSEKDGPFPKDAVYYAYANDRFDNLADTPSLLFDYPHPTIDTDIVRDDHGTYHMFFNTWGGKEGLQRRQYAFEDLHAPHTWRLIPGHMQPNSLASEGSTAFRLQDGSWMLGYDCFRDSVYQFCKTDDLMTLTLVAETRTTGNFTPRHGSIISISQQEYDNLRKRYGMD